jgi:hypothetical protein
MSMWQGKCQRRHKVHQTMNVSPRAYQSVPQIRVVIQHMAPATELQAALKLHFPELHIGRFWARRRFAEKHHRGRGRRRWVYQAVRIPVLPLFVKFEAVIAFRGIGIGQLFRKIAKRLQKDMTTDYSFSLFCRCAHRRAVIRCIHLCAGVSEFESPHSFTFFSFAQSSESAIPPRFDSRIFTTSVLNIMEQ